jgi:glycosyltransferase involved in cell wall biosynthesis
MKNRFVIISSGYKCHEYVKECFNSVINQNYDNYKLIMIDDGSNDETSNELSKLKHKNVFTESYRENEGAAFRRFNAIKKYADDKYDIILLLGLDDSLLPDCLSTINEKYNQGVWMTYGNWTDWKKKLLDIKFLEFDEITHSNRDYRKVTYRSTAPNTFRRFLFDELDESDFKIGDEWFKATTESNLMFCCLEMCGKERIGIITKPIYFYNRRKEMSTKMRIGPKTQNLIYNNIINRTKKRLLK